MEASRVPVEKTSAKYGMLKNYVDGEWKESTSSHSQDVVNPATGEVIAQVPLSTAESQKELTSVVLFPGWLNIFKKTGMNQSPFM